MNRCMMERGQYSPSLTLESAGTALPDARRIQSPGTINAASIYTNNEQDIAKEVR